MIERDPPFFFDVLCDRCSAGSERIESEDFMAVVDEIKTLGWRIVKVAGDWEHICPDCVEDGR